MLNFLSDVFRFRKTSLSLALVLCYALCFVLQEWSKGRALKVPSPEPEFLRESWTDLERIARYPHPYTSRENDVVRGYLLARVAEACDGKEYCLYETEAPRGKGQQPRPVMFNQGDTFNTSSKERRVMYFEPANVLVKIEGSDPELKHQGLLISAHYDSVPAGYGVTDDGMGIVTMLSLLRKYTQDAASRPKRTLLFNFNDDEEFGLMGSESFARHPWFQEASFFVNIDGAGSGGRALLLRATDYEVAQFYKGAKNPLANSLLQQGFQDGIIHSQTDYFVYQTNGLRGIDICFYEPRALYHTMHDSIQYASKGSLWQLITSVWGYVDLLESRGTQLQAEALSDNESTPDFRLSGDYVISQQDSVSATSFSSPNLAPAVYIDILGRWFITVSTETLADYNVGLLVVVPLVLSVLFVLAYRKKTWHLQLRGWARTPASFVVSAMITWYLAKYCILAEKPGRVPIYDSYRAAWLALSSLNIFLNYALLTASSWLLPVHDQKLIGLIELTALSWFALLWATILEKRSAKTGLFLTTVLFVCFSAGSFVGLLGFILKREPQSVHLPDQEEYSDESGEHSTAPGQSESETSPLLSSATPEPISGEDAEDVQQEIASETSSAALSNPVVVQDDRPSAKSFDWLLQFAVVVPLLVFVIYAMGDLALDSMHQSGVDNASGGKAARKFVVSCSVGLGLPVLPFLHKLNAPVAGVLGLTALLASIYTAVAPTHTNGSPLKVKFVQSIDLPAVSGSLPNDSSIAPLGKVSAYGTLRARPGFIKDIISELPSFQDNTTDLDVRFVEDEKEGTETVTYKAERPWLFDSETKSGNDFDEYLSVEVLSNSDSKKSGSYEPLNAVLRIHAAQNRMCQLDFNASGYNSFADRKRTSPVKLVTVYNSSLLNSGAKPGYREPIRANIPSGYSTDDEGNHYYKILQGIDMVQVHKLNWTQPYYQVALQWLPFTFDDDDNTDGSDPDSSRHLDVTVTCFWGEHESEVVVGGEKHRVIPAYDELVQYTPRNLITTNLKPGLVQVSQRVHL